MSSASLTTQLQMEWFQGPLPHPDLLAKYEVLAPGAAKQIIDLMSSQTEHRQHLEKAVVASNIAAQRLGQILAALVVISALLVSGWMAADGRELAAGVVGGGGLFSLAGVFITGRWRQEKERDRALSS